MDHATKATLTNFANVIKKKFASTLSVSGRTVTLKNGLGEALSTEKLKGVPMFAITEDMVTVTTSDTKGVAPYSTSYGMTYIEIDKNAGIEWVEGALYTFVVNTKMVVASATRNVAIRIGGADDGDVWHPLFGTSAIVAGSSYLVKAWNTTWQYKTVYRSEGALHLQSDSNTTYAYLVNTVIGDTTDSVVTIDSNGYGARYSLIFPTTPLSAGLTAERFSSLVASSGTGSTKLINPLVNKYYIDRSPLYVYSANIAKGAKAVNSVYQDYTGTDLRYVGNTSNTYIIARRRCFLVLHNFDPSDMSFKPTANASNVGDINIVTADKLSTLFPSTTAGTIYLYLLGTTTATWYSLTPVFTQTYRIYKYVPSTGALSIFRDSEPALANKVDKVDGKQLSTEDFTTTLKNKLDGIAAGANATTVDSALSSTSTNPVQNKVVNTALGNKVDKVDGKGLSTNDFTAALKTKLDGIATGANAYTLPAATASALGGIKLTGGLSDGGSGVPKLAWDNVNVTNDAVLPLDTIGLPILAQNRFEALPASCVKSIEYSLDDGATWSAYPSLTDNMKKLLFITSIGTSLRLNGNNGNDATAHEQLKIHINIDGYVYTAPKRMYFNVSTNGQVGMKVKIEYKDRGDDKPWIVWNTYNLSGWSGWNSVPFTKLTGGSSTQFDRAYEFKFTFYYTSKATNASWKTAPEVIRIGLLGESAWAYPSNLAKHGHLYSFDGNLNATFPAGVTATSFTGNASSATKATQDASGNTITTTYATKNELGNKVDKVSGKGLSANDFTTDLKNKLDGIASGATAVTESTVSGWGFTKNTGTGTYSKPSGGIPKTDLASAVQTSLGKADTALQSFTESDPTVPAHVKSITSDNITAWNGVSNKVDKVDGKGLSSNDFTTTLKNKLDGIASGATAVSETTVSGWGFTKNAGTYSKPSTGIPKTDLASAVQTSLGKADSALQSYTETDPTVPSHVKSITADNITAWNGVSNKVDKVSGKGLSTNDFTTALKNKLDGIAAGATAVTVDTALNANSNNAISNAAVYAAIATYITGELNGGV